MKLSISNLLLAVLAFSIALGWYVGRSSLNQKLEREVAARGAASRVLRKAKLFATFRDVDTGMDNELFEIIDRRSEAAEHFLNLMSIYQLCDSVSDPSLAKHFARGAMGELGCKDLEDLRALLARAKWDFRIVTEDGTEESDKFKEYLEQVMRSTH